MKRRLAFWLERAFEDPNKSYVFVLSDIMVVVMGLYLYGEIEYRTIMAFKPLFRCFFDKKPGSIKDIEKKLTVHELFHKVLITLLSDVNLRVKKITTWNQLINYLNGFLLYVNFKDCLREIYHMDWENMVLTESGVLYFVDQNCLREIELDQDCGDWLKTESELLLHGISKITRNKAQNVLILQVLHTGIRLEMDLSNKNVEVFYDKNQRRDMADDIMIGEFQFTKGEIHCKKVLLDAGYYDQRKEEIGFLNTKMPGVCTYDLVTMRPVIHLYGEHGGVNTTWIPLIEEAFGYKPGEARLVFEEREIER